MQVQEITNFKSGIDVSLDPILSPPDAFVNLNNGFVYRGVLQSRTGFRHFADGTSSTFRRVSRVANEITDEQPTDNTTSLPAVGNGNTTYVLDLANTQIERSIVTITTTTPAKSVTFTFNSEGGITVTGDDGVGTNSIDWQLGQLTVTFDAAITADPILVTYNYHPDLAIMGIHEYMQTSGVRELIVLDEDFPYVYDATNNDFDRIDFGDATTSFTGSTDNFFTFQNWRLNSRGAVPAVADPLALSDILFFTNNVDVPFFYDGTDIKEVTSANLPEYREPPEGSLDKALHVLAFGERLCWLRPTLGGIEFPQAILWGPINDTGGLALDYQGSGSGMLSAVTDSVITGFKFLRDSLIVWFETDVYALELTDDNFRPFKWTKLEDERGVEPTHGTVGYLGDVQSPGRLGILATNGRRVEKVDNKIPFFTRDRIDGDLITHVFGEEMEEDSQFWWTYPPQDGVDITTSTKVLVKNFEENNYATYDIRVSVLNKTILGQGVVWDNLQHVFGNPDPDDGDVGEFEGPVADVTWDKWGNLGQNYRTIFGDHHGFIFVVGDSFSDGAFVISPNLSDDNANAVVSSGTTTVVQTEYHNFNVDDIVEFRNLNGMVEMNGLTAMVTAVNSQSEFVVNIDSSDFTAYTSGGEVIKPINFEGQFVPFNPLRPQGKRVNITRMDFLVKSNTGEYSINFFENRLPDQWTQEPISGEDSVSGTTYKFSSTAVENDDIWFSIVVDENADFHTWKISQNKANEQVAVKSIRVYFKDGGESNN